MKISTVLLAGWLVLFATARAERVQPPDLGLSVWVPSGWALTNEGGDSSFRLYTLYDTTGNHSVLFALEVIPDVIAGGGEHQWVQFEALVRGMIIEGSCSGRLISDDSTTIHGRYTREVHGRAASCDDGSNVPSTELQDRFSRIMASGDIGWVMTYETDTADADTAFRTYRALLDSMRIDPSFQSLPQVGIRDRHELQGWPRIVAHRRGLAISLGAAFRPDITVTDLFGRALSGAISAQSEGRWVWRPESPHPGTVVVRIRSGALLWRQRVVLPR